MATATPLAPATFPHDIVCIGDSLTRRATLGYHLGLSYPAYLQRTLNTQNGTNARCRNFGHSGDTTLAMLQRLGQWFKFGSPSLSIIYGGVNDPASSYSIAQTTGYLGDLILAAQFGCSGYVSGQATLPALPHATAIGTRYIVDNDTSATGGCPAWGNLTPNLPLSQWTSGGSYVWECRSDQAGVMGWGRVAGPKTTPDRCPLVAVLGCHYLNWTSGGDITLAATGISNANPAVLTIAAHGFTTGQQLVLSGSGIGIDGTYLLTVVDTNHVSIPVQGVSGYSGSGAWATQAYGAWNTTSTGIRYAQQQAVMAQSNNGQLTGGDVIYVDLWSWMRNMIVNGVNTQGDLLWDFATGDWHLTPYGNILIAQAIQSALVSASWTTALA